MRENDGLTAAPILVVNLYAVFHCDRVHVFFFSRLIYIPQVSEEIDGIFDK